MESVLGSGGKPNCLIIDEIDGAPMVGLGTGHAGIPWWGAGPHWPHASHRPPSRCSWVCWTARAHRRQRLGLPGGHDIDERRGRS